MLSTLIEKIFINHFHSTLGFIHNLLGFIVLIASGCNTLEYHFVSDRMAYVGVESGMSIN